MDTVWSCAGSTVARTEIGFDTMAYDVLCEGRYHEKMGFRYDEQRFIEMTAGHLIAVKSRGAEEHDIGW